ncbi:MAG: CPBP family intramembrane metalloprotease [Agathobacter sp.]|nr:CPBP family intramembrane metalloprotease [Agathobacter sp.]
MSKVKTVFFAIVPTLLSVALQFFAVYYLLFIAAIFLFGIGPSITGHSYDMSDLMELTLNMDFNTVAMIIFSFCCIITFGIWYKKRCGGSFRLNLKKEFHPLEILGILFLVPGTQYLSAFVASLVSVIFPSWLETYEQMLETAGLGEDITLIMFIYSVFMAPISEELIFRGVTLRIAQRVLPFALANTLQAALFGLFHMNPLQGCYTFIIGLILGYIIHKGGTIYHVILFHFLFNLWGTTAAQWMIDLNPMFQGFIVILSLTLGLSLGFFFFNHGNQKKQNKCI